MLLWPMVIWVNAKTAQKWTLQGIGFGMPSGYEIMTVNVPNFLIGGERPFGLPEDGVIYIRNDGERRFYLVMQSDAV